MTLAVAGEDASGQLLYHSFANSVLPSSNTDIVPMDIGTMHGRSGR